MGHRHLRWHVFWKGQTNDPCLLLCGGSGSPGLLGQYACIPRDSLAMGLVASKTNIFPIEAFNQEFKGSIPKTRVHLFRVQSTDSVHWHKHLHKFVTILPSVGIQRLVLRNVSTKRWLLWVELRLVFHWNVYRFRRGLHSHLRLGYKGSPVMVVGIIIGEFSTFFPTCFQCTQIGTLRQESQKEVIVLPCERSHRRSIWDRAHILIPKAKLVVVKIGIVGIAEALLELLQKCLLQGAKLCFLRSTHMNWKDKAGQLGNLQMCIHFTRHAAPVSTSASQDSTLLQQKSRDWLWYSSSLKHAWNFTSCRNVISCSSNKTVTSLWSQFSGANLSHSTARGSHLSSLD